MSVHAPPSSTKFYETLPVKPNDCYIFYRYIISGVFLFNTGFISVIDSFSFYRKKNKKNPFALKTFRSSNFQNVQVN